MVFINDCSSCPFKLFDLEVWLENIPIQTQSSWDCFRTVSFLKTFYADDSGAWSSIKIYPQNVQTFLLLHFDIHAFLIYILQDESTCDIKFSTLPPMSWSAVDCAKHLMEKKEISEDTLMERRAKQYGSYRSMKNG